MKSPVEVICHVNEKHTALAWGPSPDNGRWLFQCEICNLEGWVDEERVKEQAVVREV